MTTNQYYYNGTTTNIGSEAAHALKDKSKLIVADKALTLTTINKMLEEMNPEEEE